MFKKMFPHQKRILFVFFFTLITGVLAFAPLLENVGYSTNLAEFDQDDWNQGLPDSQISYVYLIKGEREIDGIWPFGASYTYSRKKRHCEYPNDLYRNDGNTIGRCDYVDDVSFLGVFAGFNWEEFILYNTILWVFLIYQGLGLNRKEKKYPN